MVRRKVISQLVSRYVNKYFKDEGLYVEAGCGAGETSLRLSKIRFTRIGLDISIEALKRAKSLQIYDSIFSGTYLIFHSKANPLTVYGTLSNGTF